MKCKNCGTENSNNARFCRNCGYNEFLESYGPTKTSRTNILLIIALIILIVVLLSGGLFAYTVYFDTSDVEVFTLSATNGANVYENSEIQNNIPDSEITRQIIAQATSGVPVYKIGDGKEPVTVITSGVHGDQLNPSVASMELIRHLNGRKIKGTVYVIPFVSPEAVSKNTKLINGVNLNQAADELGTISYEVVQFAKNNNATAVGDFHETQIGKNPGVTTIMCSQIPNYDSYQLAKKMSSLSSDDTMTYLVAGIEYDGAIEDELNLKGTTAVTPLVQVPSHGKVYDSAVLESYEQMLALLYANGNFDQDDFYLKIANMDIDGI